MSSIGNLNHSRDPNWIKGFPNSQEQAKREGKTYFLNPNKRCLDCALVSRWADTGYCMQCNPRGGA